MRKLMSPKLKYIISCLSDYKAQTLSKKADI